MAGHRRRGLAGHHQRHFHGAMAELTGRPSSKKKELDKPLKKQTKPEVKKQLDKDRRKQIQEEDDILLLGDDYD